MKIEGIAHINLGVQGASMLESMIRPMVQNIPVYHFMKTDYFVDLVSKSQLWVRRADLFGDPDEGVFAQSAINNSLGDAFPGFHLESDDTEVRRFQELDRMCRFIHCWHAGESASELMWGKYGDQSCGICLLSSTAKIRAAVKALAHVSGGIHAVTYCDENNPAMEIHSALPYCRKGMQFQKEQEISLVATMELSHPFLHGATLPGNKWPDHLKLDVDLRAMLSGIIFGSSMGGGDAARIADYVHTRLGDIPCTKL